MEAGERQTHWSVLMDIISTLARAADKCGFTRNRWVEKDIPTSLSNICAMLFLGDIRSNFILSSMLLKRYREQIKTSKYFILCTWPGYEGLFPYANEVWTIREEGNLKKLFVSARGFENESDVHFRRELNYWLEDVTGPEPILSFYNDGITKEFWEKFKHIRRYLISVPSSSILGTNFNHQLTSSGAKILIHPVEYVRSWKHGTLTYLKTPKEFWVKLAEVLIDAKIIPVVYQNFATHDLSTELLNRCVYTTEKDITKLMGIMRTVGCVLDVFSGISRLAVGARAPFVAVDERSRYNSQKEYEIDDLLMDKMHPRKYIFSFPNVLNENNNEIVWKNNFYDVILSTVSKFLSELDREKWPSPTEREEIVLYDNVRKMRINKMGTHFLKVNKDLRNITWQ
jgi:hypothetical protein